MQKKHELETARPLRAQRNCTREGRGPATKKKVPRPQKTKRTTEAAKTGGGGDGGRGRGGGGYVHADFSWPGRRSSPRAATVKATTPKPHLGKCTGFKE